MALNLWCIELEGGGFASWISSYNCEKMSDDNTLWVENGDKFLFLFGATIFYFVTYPSIVAWKVRYKIDKINFFQVVSYCLFTILLFPFRKKTIRREQPLQFSYYPMIYIPSCHEKSSLAKNIHQVVQKDWLTQPIEGLRTCSTSLVQFDLLSKYSTSLTGVSVD